MQKGLVSIIIPAYNMEDYLQKCLDSITNQTYEDYEIIVVDDGSTDNTLNICKKNKSENEKINIIHQKNTGVSSARNVGMQLAQGEYIVFLDADDYVSEIYLETLVLGMQKSQMTIIGFTNTPERLIRKMPDDNCYSNISAFDVKDKILCGTEYDGYLWNKIFNNEIIKKNQLHFINNVTVWEDLYFVIKYLECIKEVSVNDSKLYFYRYREGSAVNSDRLDKYQSKYYIWSLIYDALSNESRNCKQRVSYLYYEVTLSYCNKLLNEKNRKEEIVSILEKIKFIELVKQKSLMVIIKYLYLKLIV